jgi:hypothetical protein
MSIDCLEISAAYPLCSDRAHLDPHDLKSYHSELERREPELFVTNEASCRTEIREHISYVQALLHHQPSKQDNCFEPGSLSESHTVNSFDDLRTALNVSCFGFHNHVVVF